MCLCIVSRTDDSAGRKAVPLSAALGQKTSGFPNLLSAQAGIEHGTGFLLGDVSAVEQGHGHGRRLAVVTWAPSSPVASLTTVLCCSCCGSLCLVRLEAEGGRIPTQQQDSSSVYEGGQELSSGRRALQEGARPGAAH